MLALAFACGDASDRGSSSADGPDGLDVAVIEVVDGDSIAVDIDGNRVEVRLFGINAPEWDECHGDGSRQMTEQLIGDTVRLVMVGSADPEDQFGRLLRDVWVGDLWINAALVESGAAVALHSGAASQPTLLALNEDAWSGRVGMWATDVCGSAPDGISISEVTADPPGRDEENLDAERVVITNDSATPVDISGWVVRDESSRHRFRFPAGTVLAGGEAVAVTSGCEPGPGFCGPGPVWNNAGDAVLLEAGEGTVVDRYPYP